ncbi:MAG: ATP-binding protein [Gaiellales bacterium]
MRARTLRIHGFGRLTEREFELGDGLTIVHGPNEAGKSTLHAALTASLVGLAPGGRRTPRLAAAVERHRPWTHDRYASRLDLELATGRRLRLDWDFARWAFTVTDASTGDDITSDLGAGTDTDALCRKLYGASRDAYLKVASIPQGELTAIGESADVRQALERVASQSGEADGAAGATAVIRSRRSRLVGLNRSRTNPLPQAIERVESLEAELAAVQRERADAEQEAAERDRLGELAAGFERRQNELEMAHAAARARVLRRRVERAAAVDRERQSAVAIMDAAPVNGWHPVSGLAGARERVVELEGRAVDAQPALDEARARLDGLNAEPMPANVDPPRPHAAGVALLLAGAGVAAVGAGLGQTALLAAGIAIAALGGGLWASAARTAGRRRRQATAERELLLEQRRSERARLTADIARLEVVSSELASARGRIAELLGIEPDPVLVAESLETYDLLADRHRAHELAAHRREVADAELRSLLGDHGLDQLSLTLAEMEGELNGHRNAPGADRDPDQIEQELADLRRRREQALVQGESSAARVAERLRTLPDAAGLVERLAAARAEVERLERMDAVLRLAELELEQAAAETYRDFAPRLNAALQQQLSRVTRGRYHTAYVADDLSVRLEAPETGAPIDLGQTSLGTQKLAYLVQRLELTRLLAPAGEPLPVLLDDPFAHLDRTRLGDALALLADLAGERQLVVFTTQPEVVELAPAGTVLIEL